MRAKARFYWLFPASAGAMRVVCVVAIQIRFTATLKLPFKFSPNDPHVRWGCRTAKIQPPQRRINTGVVMARFEMAGFEPAMLGQGPLSADAFYDLGIRYAVGNAVAADLVTAHKWFNIAAMKGSAEAVRQRQDIAANMSPAQIAEALRAARAWLTAH
jgi:hypothetical protein